MIYNLSIWHSIKHTHNHYSITQALRFLNHKHIVIEIIVPTHCISGGEGQRTSVQTAEQTRNIVHNSKINMLMLTFKYTPDIVASLQMDEQTHCDRRSGDFGWRFLPTGQMAVGLCYSLSSALSGLLLLLLLVVLLSTTKVL